MSASVTTTTDHSDVNRYERVRVLGRGSYGTAVLVRTASSGRPGSSGSRAHSAGPLRVVKEVDFIRADDKCRTEALKEAEVLKSLSHPNIIGYEDAFLEEGRLCIVMEYADGGDLWAAIARRRSSGCRYHEREALAIFVQVVLALEYVHSRRILHRDIKSQNVFLTAAGAVKLGDFGIARVLEDNEAHAATRVGTPSNLPPEMCENRPYDFKADIWGLGVLLYESLALEVPFSGSSVAGLVVRICTSEPKPIPAVYSSELRALVGRMLAKRAEDRPTASEVAALSHVRRGLAAMKPASPIITRVTSKSSSTCSSAGIRAVQSQFLMPPSLQVCARTDWTGKQGRHQEPVACESPKRVRLSLPMACSNKSPVLLPCQVPDGDHEYEGFIASPSKKSRISYDVLKEARSFLGAGHDSEYDPTSPESRSRVGMSPSLQATRPASAEGLRRLGFAADERSPILRQALGERSPWSASCTALLFELERELRQEESTQHGKGSLDQPGPIPIDEESCT
eukprot:gb/GFBE01067563.1/.p1 GENE.gb/GFBE01067563.1/~~gb/GFBE01067563.1/.p1  ORF type:complete len:511 (+),score=84.83 gb/GFBE01067563.1/:1-1533(+)